MKRFFKIMIFLVTSYLAFLFISGYFSERVSDYVKHEATNASTKIIKEVISKGLVEKNDLNLLVQNEVGLVVNTLEINKLLSTLNLELINNIQKFKEIDDLKLPLGIIFSDVLLNIGPNIKIKLFPIGSAKTDVVTTVEEFGINNSVFEVDIIVTMEFQTLIPLNNQNIVVSTKIPLISQVVQGDVPRYYGLIK